MAVPKHKILKSVKRQKMHYYGKNKLNKQNKQIGFFLNYLKENNLEFKHCPYCESNLYLFKTTCYNCIYNRKFRQRFFYLPEEFIPEESLNVKKSKRLW